MADVLYRLVEIVCGAAFLTLAARCLGADLWHASGFACFTITAIGYLCRNPIRGAAESDSDRESFPGSAS